MGNHYWILGNGHRVVFFKQKNNFNCYGIVDFTNVGNFSSSSDFARNNFSKFKPLTSYFGRSVYNKKYNYNNCGINNRKKIFDFEQEKYLSRKRQATSIITFGANVNFGDQLHHTVAIDLETYKKIGHAFASIKSI